MPFWSNNQSQRVWEKSEEVQLWAKSWPWESESNWDPEPHHAFKGAMFHPNLHQNPQTREDGMPEAWTTVHLFICYMPKMMPKKSSLKVWTMLCPRESFPDFQYFISCGKWAKWDTVWRHQVSTALPPVSRDTFLMSTCRVQEGARMF